jgi:hypothetical protein
MARRAVDPESCANAVIRIARVEESNQLMIGLVFVDSELQPMHESPFMLPLDLARRFSLELDEAVGTAEFNRTGVHDERPDADGG